MQLNWNDLKGKFAKLLINPITGGNAQVNNPDTWNDYMTAVEAARRGEINGHRVDGIGYVLTGEDGIVGIDIDLDKKRGQITPQGREIIEKLQNKTYMEHSASGAIHIFGYGTKHGKECRGKDDSTLEMYGGPTEGNRCLMLTGKLYKDTFTKLGAIQAEVDAIHTAYFKRPELQRAISRTSLTLSDNEVISTIMASKSGDKFDGLMRGDVSRYDNDYSKADLALCSIIAFFSQDKRQIDSIYRQSQLYSASKINTEGRLESRAEKWDSRRTGGTYGSLTIDFAIKNVLKTYDGRPQQQRMIDIEPQRVYAQTEKAVLIKLPIEGNKKADIWIPIGGATVRDNAVIAIAQSYVEKYNVPLKKRIQTLKKC
jgi:putative DNA primase/helicase